MNSKKIKHKEIVMDEVTIQPFNKKKKINRLLYHKSALNLEFHCINFPINK